MTRLYCGARLCKNDHAVMILGVRAPSFGASEAVRAASLFFTCPYYRRAIDTEGQTQLNKVDQTGIETVHDG